MDKNFSMLQSAVRKGMNKVAGPPPPDRYQIYQQFKQQKFAPVIQKYGLIPTLAYIRKMEQEMKENSYGI